VTEVAGGCRNKRKAEEADESNSDCQESPEAKTECSDGRKWKTQASAQ
jgi:hypothetical protein